MKNFTGYIKKALTTGNSEAPSLSAGGSVEFKLDLPISDRHRALYLPFIELSVAGPLVQSAGTGARIFWDNFWRMICASVEVKGTLLGRPVRESETIGAYMPYMEILDGGYATPNPYRGAFPAANGTYNFHRRCRIWLGGGPNEKPHHLWQLALLYRGGMLKFTAAAASVLSTFSPGGSITFGGSTVLRATAHLTPDPEIRIAPGIEWADYVVEASSGKQLNFKAVGDSSGFNDVESGAAVMAALLATTANGLPGAFAATALTRLGIPWLGQDEIDDIASFLGEARDAMPPQLPRGSVVDQAAALAATDFSGWPNKIGAAPSNELVGFTDDLLFIPIKSPGYSMELSKLDTIENMLSLLATFSSSSGTHHLLLKQVKRWTAAAMQKYLNAVKTSGLATEVLGPLEAGQEYGYGGSPTLTKTPVGGIETGKALYLPLTINRIVMNK